MRQFAAYLGAAISFTVTLGGIAKITAKMKQN
jgi:hypothetical protein